MTDNTEIMQLLMMNTIGLSILHETLKTASRFNVASSSYNIKSEKYQCYAFVQGSGLDQLLVDYHLDYNPSYLRSSFNYYINRIGHNGKN